ncbi:Transglutaminase-like superfamily protein [Acetitomaculum ruminis DSM 5522]|uniref:Transglutaminase-like superfamily protein n=1 Tax=Acetitomaculum ruminis DSM 5522 TaxID=1120918 RepID=A0A1I0ZC21_9FIRM|nr:lasso peptide biosynthesis B2 protein [Acetitomaculum ruminis]SFB23184.1 Transglutaminase-like superfamily protein [Acetitomaculum ruminis DSM 5522]
MKSLKTARINIILYILMGFYRLQILLISSDKLRKHWGKEGEESPKTEPIDHYYYARYICKHIDKISKKTPWESKCLVQALTARFLLNRKHINNTLYLGVGRDESGKMVAHAWIRTGEAFVTGGNGEGYGKVASFANIF